MIELIDIYYNSMFDDISILRELLKQGIIDITEYHIIAQAVERGFNAIVGYGYNNIKDSVGIIIDKKKINDR